MAPTEVTEITDEWHSIASLKARLTRPNSDFLVADDGKRIGGVAFAESIDGGKMVVLRQLYVLPSLQGRGIGGMLLDEIIESFPEADAIRLEVEARNTRAIAFYEANGFVRSGAPASAPVPPASRRWSIAGLLPADRFGAHLSGSPSRERCGKGGFRLTAQRVTHQAAAADRAEAGMGWRARRRGGNHAKLAGTDADPGVGRNLWWRHLSHRRANWCRCCRST